MEVSMDPFMMGIGSGAIGAVGNLIGTGIGQQFSASQVAQQEAFQMNMSDTSWQRGVADMKAAGLNPDLAFSKGGASAPTGGAASSGGPDLGGPLSGMASTAMAKMRLDQELKNNAMGDVEQTQRINSLAAAQAKSSAETTKTAAETALAAQRLRLGKPDEERAKADSEALSTSAVQAVRKASTIADESARGVGAAKDIVNPFSRLLGAPSARSVFRGAGQDHYSGVM